MHTSMRERLILIIFAIAEVIVAFQCWDFWTFVFGIRISAFSNMICKIAFSLLVWYFTFCCVPMLK
jgi:hypothetical protein